MARTWPVDPQAWRDLLAPMGPEMIVGATLAHPGVFPEGFGIGRRTQPRSDYLGLITTWPEQNTFVFGVNYFDNDDGHDNEDMYKLNLTTFEMTPYMGRTFEQEYPEYAGHHWAAKPFLRKPDKS